MDLTDLTQPQQQPYGQSQYGQQPPYGQAAAAGAMGAAGAYAAVQANPADAAMYKQLLQEQIRDKGLERFIPYQSPELDRIAAKAPQQVAALCQRWNVPKEVGQGIVKLALFDIVIYIGANVSRRSRSR
jgi:hypothetical protein